ncbi:hypothetical protein FRC04_000027 [Tulasnella sp. 424]|nr:hypothetical protein FRC04_000027 [Tulasnella sp. 424]KAG8981891.1 hypothetical protein FRC05_000033 [Tulasnella sp. 425]
MDRAALVKYRPVRSGRTGTVGRSIDIFTNNFEILNFPEGKWYHYAGMIALSSALPRLTNELTWIDLAPIVDISSPNDTANPQFRRDERNQRVIQHLKLNDIRFGEGVYDGKAIFFSRSELGPILEMPNVFDSQRPINVTFTRIQVVDFSILQQFARGLSQVAVNMLNILLRETPSQRQGADQSIVVKRRAIYSTADMRPIRGGFQVADGFIQSVRPGSPRMVVNVNYTSGVTWQPGPLPDLLKEVLKLRNWNFPRTLESDMIRGEQIREINKLIRGIKVMAPHLDGRKRKRPLVISGLHSKNAQTYRFDCNFGNVSVAQYFQMQYNRVLYYPTLCLVSIRSNDEILFPIETLVVLPGQLVSKAVKLFPSQVAEIQRIAQDMKPSPRLKSIADSLRSNQVLAYENAPVLVSSKFRIDLRPMISKARLLPPPDVLYRGNAKPSIARGAWNMMQLKVWQSPQPVEKWAICVISPRCDRGAAYEFGSTLVGICGQMGIPLNPKFQIFEGPTPMDVLGNCGPASFVLCILNGPETSHKEAIKKWGDIQHGIPTQIILWDKISDRGGRLNGRNKLDQYCRNLGLKINAKLGGINCIPPSLPGIVLHETIIIGLDVSHPSPGALGPSVAAMASSVDPACSFYIGQSQLQQPRQEAIEELRVMVTHALRQQFMYITRGLNKKYMPPKQVLLFRDGVSEGQFIDIIETEITQVKGGISDWLAEVKKNAGLTMDMPRLTFVVVGKKHHFRMFAPRDHQPHHTRVDNCQSGTVIDSHVTNPYWDDYYLLSHAAILGTSRPAHYSVLWDETGFTADHKYRSIFVTSTPVQLELSPFQRQVESSLLAGID